MGGRVTAVAVVEKHPSIVYAAAASGGLWKSDDGGASWAPVFAREATVSLGDVAVAPSNPEVVWVGTGEANPRNSVSWGDGVYKSTDGGKTWKNMGLRETGHIGRVVIHPTNPDVVYVAALGRLWGPSRERGLYKTADGGRTWQHAKFLDADTGFIDLAMDPADPSTLYAAAYRVRRGPFAGNEPAEQFGPAAGLYKTLDGGKSWRKLAGGLPERPLGRCGLCVCRKDPRVLYAVVQTDKTALLRKDEWGQPARTNDRAETGGLFRSADRGETWVKVNDICPRPFYFSQVRADPNDDRLVYVLGVRLHVSRDGGRTFDDRDAAASVHADLHALWINPKDSNHLVLGSDGGVSSSHSRGAAWEPVTSLPIGQFYAAAVDMRRPYRVYGGLQDNGTWGGPSRTHDEEGITAGDWLSVLGMDGFHCQADPVEADVLYAEGQWGDLRRVKVSTRESARIRPQPSRGAPEYRFNWSAPILLSPHDRRTLYFGGNHVFRSRDRGDHWETISPDLTHGRPGRSADTGHTITVLTESPLRAGLLWVGSDDGRVHVTRNGGGDWADVSARIPGVPQERWVSRIECSHFAEGTAYLALDRHRNDDRRPYLFRTTDCGATWEPLMRTLPPEGPVHVVRESSRNQDLLFAGTEFGLFVSLDRGAAWHRLRGLPTVAVHDLVIHPRDRELVIATHGRSLYVMDVAPLEEMTAEVLAVPAHLFAIRPATTFESCKASGLGGVRGYAAPNPPYGALVHYHLREKAAGPVRLTITDERGKTVFTAEGPAEAGLQRLTWSLRTPAGKEAAPGEYLAHLRVAGRLLSRRFRVEAEE
jgi:photosystem II stability/assembly factor-like uncharacterized protein